MSRAIVHICSNVRLFAAWDTASFRHIGCKKRARAWISVFMAWNWRLKTALHASKSHYRRHLQVGYSSFVECTELIQACNLLRWHLEIRGFELRPQGACIPWWIDLDAASIQSQRTVFITSGVTGEWPSIFLSASGCMQIRPSAPLIKIHHYFAHNMNY